eukprot:1911964-Amphidinium_carterae.1
MLLLIFVLILRHQPAHLPSRWHHHRDCTGGGLVDAQCAINLPSDIILTKVPGDGNCFYHAVLAASHERLGSRRDSSAWTLDALRGWAGHE